MSSALYDIALSYLYRTRLRYHLSLLERYKTAEEAWRHLDEAGMDEAERKAQRELEWISQHGIQVWTLSDDSYPYRLRQCPDCPPVLYSKGNVNPSDAHMVSIVGTRRPTERGKELTYALVRDLHDRIDQLTIVSGGAYGIDINAHRAAMDFEVPTIIVPAHGLDRIYPVQHRQDAIRALENGGLLTEFPSGTEPFAPYFIQRNRIIAGLADAVVVVESKEKGGSLITARMAVDYNRELFAFPGRPQDEAARGCNQLIRNQKAQLIQDADDLIATMGWTTRQDKGKGVQTQLIGLNENLSDSQQQLLQKLQEAEEGLHINLIVMETGLPYGDVASDLVMMEIDGLVKSMPGGVYRIVR
ncbi:MAG: DNA-processing protein DprA [Paludibacteraceae bacterium]|nr:DNA-processing protein DprA [Paludibacteraceae bacterium]